MEWLSFFLHGQLLAHNHRVPLAVAAAHVAHPAESAKVIKDIGDFLQADPRSHEGAGAFSNLHARERSGATPPHLISAVLRNGRNAKHSDCSFEHGKCV